MSDLVQVALIGAMGSIGVALITELARFRRSNSQEHGRTYAVAAEMRDDLRDTRADVRAVKDDVREIAAELTELRGQQRVLHEENVVQSEHIEARLASLEQKAG